MGEMGRELDRLLFAFSLDEGDFDYFGSMIQLSIDNLMTLDMVEISKNWTTISCQ